jgi:LVIVD repeat
MKKAFRSWITPLALVSLSSFLVFSGCGSSTPSTNTTPNPVPTITTLSPTSATAGDAAQTLTINGTDFVSGATAKFNGTAHTVTFISATQLTIPLTASDEASGGTFAVLVTNPTPGGGNSNSVNFTVNNPSPAITSLDPSTLPQGSAAQTLTINGTGFVSTSTVTFNGTAHTATFVSSTVLTIPLTVSDLGSPGTPDVVVTNPTPGGGSSSAFAFVVSAAAGPTVAGLVYKGPEGGATVNVYPVQSDGSNGISLGTTTTDGSGIFSVTLNSTPSGAIRITATGGTYTSESDGSAVTGTSSISALVDSASSGVSGIVITPVSEFINSYATGLMKAGTAASESDAHASATSLLDNFYSFTLGTMPETLTPKFAKADITGSPDAFKLGFIISTLALEGHTLNPASPDDLIAGLSADISDGIWDGLADGVPIPFATAKSSLSSAIRPRATTGTSLPTTAGTSDWLVNLSLCVTACTSVTSNGIGIVDVSALLASMSTGVSACTCTPAAVGLNASSSGAVATLAYQPAGLSGTHQYLFVAGRDNGVVVVDITDPTATSPLIKKWPSIVTGLGGPVGGVIPVIIPGQGHPDLFVYAFQSSKKFALLNIDKLISGTDPDPTVYDSAPTDLPILSTSPVGFSGGSAFVSGGIPAGGAIFLSTADGYGELTQDSVSTGTWAQLFPVEDPNQIIAENMGGDVVHGLLLGGNYGGIQLVDLNVNKSFYMPYYPVISGGNALSTYFPDINIIDGNSIDTKYRVGILTGEDENVVGFLNLATITETVSTTSGVLNSFAPATGGTAENFLTSSFIEISGSAVDPTTHLALFMAGYSSDLAVGLVQDPTLATPCPSSSITTWQGLCDWRYYNINTSPSLSSYTYATDPHAVGVVVSQGIGNSATTGLAYGYLLDTSSAGSSTGGVVQIDLGAFLNLTANGATGDAAHQPSVDPAATVNPTTGDLIMKEFRF